MLNEVFDGVFPGATEWTESPAYHSWYREEGRWSCLINPEEGRRRAPCWGIRVWRSDRGMDERDANLWFDEVECEPHKQYEFRQYDNESLAVAKRKADGMLRSRAAGRQQAPTGGETEGAGG